MGLIPDRGGLWGSAALQPLGLQECIVPFWKPLMPLSYEPKGQGRGSAFRTCYALLNKIWKNPWPRVWRLFIGFYQGFIKALSWFYLGFIKVLSRLAIKAIFQGNFSKQFFQETFQGNFLLQFFKWYLRQIVMAVFWQKSSQFLHYKPFHSIFENSVFVDGTSKLFLRPLEDTSWSTRNETYFLAFSE